MKATNSQVVAAQLIEIICAKERRGTALRLLLALRGSAIFLRTGLFRTEIEISVLKNRELEKNFRCISPFGRGNSFENWGPLRQISRVGKERTEMPISLMDFHL